MAATRVVGEKKLKVFISYSRKDLAFAQRMLAALEAHDLAPKIDMRDLPKMEDWRRELLGFIREADGVSLSRAANPGGEKQRSFRETSTAMPWTLIDSSDETS